MLLSSIVLYDRYWKKLPMRKLIGGVQILYALSLLLDLVLVKQINLKLGIPNETFALCFSGVAETVAQFKLLPFSVLWASLCPPGSEAALTSFLASALCLSSIISGFLGIGLSSLIGITSGEYSRLLVDIFLQFDYKIVTSTASRYPCSDTNSDAGSIHKLTPLLPIFPSIHCDHRLQFPDNEVLRILWHPWPLTLFKISDGDMMGHHEGVLMPIVRAERPWQTHMGKSTRRVAPRSCHPPFNWHV
ncbi:Biopterin transporter family [Dillenia turbinata]|uniref:Biopterin transporter family n=1 Tax=Dillenia turbinata TaxID=194707 RepID=A0AAN8UZH9_9MAGN